MTNRPVPPTRSSRRLPAGSLLPLQNPTLRRPHFPEALLLAGIWGVLVRFVDPFQKEEIVLSLEILFDRQDEGPASRNLEVIRQLLDLLEERRLDRDCCLDIGHLLFPFPQVAEYNYTLYHQQYLRCSMGIEFRRQSIETGWDLPPLTGLCPMLQS